MRRANFFITAIVALATFISLQVFVGHGAWGWRAYGPYGYGNRNRYHNFYYRDDYLRNNRQAPGVPIDTTEKNW